MKKILIAMPHYRETCTRGYQKLVDHGFEITEIPYDRDYTVEELKEAAAEIEGVIADAEKWCEETIASAPDLKVIARFGTGMDSVDVEAAKKHQVVVTNCPGLNANTVAEQAVSLLLSAVRQIPYLDRDVKAGGWNRLMVSERGGGTVGILGFGNIGQKVAEKLSGFGCRLLAYDAFPNKEAADRLQVEMVSCDRLLNESDCITIHMPLLPDTLHSVNADFFRKVKDSAIIINTARGALVDEQALYHALKEKKIAAYACDVFEQEPPGPDFSVFSFEQCIFTPHIAGESYENREITGLATADAVIDVLEGREPENRRA